jgi:putative membrane protein
MPLSLRNSVLPVTSVIVLAILLWSGLAPFDRATWIMETLPVMIAYPVLWFTYQRFPLTHLLYILIAIHALILIIGGAYTYAHVPIGFDLQALFGLQRNPYDKIGHFFQGLVPALVAREILIRGAYVNGRKMLIFIVVCIVLAISATYELIEWAAALAMGQGADEFLGTQGDEWDSQADMFFALIGAISALLTLSRWQDRQIEKLPTHRND